MPERSELGQQLPLRGPLKALEADIHHANTMANAIQRNYGGACVQMRLSCSSLAPFFLYLVQWLDCGCCYTLPSYLGLFHILICKVYADGDSSVSTYERRASLREFYAVIYPIMQQLEGNLMERDLKGKGRCKDIVSRKRLEDWRKVCNKDVEREDECGICMETCTKMVLPNCSHAMCIKCYRDWYRRSESCPFCRGSLKRIRSRDLWVLTNYNDVVDPLTLERENVRHFYSYIDSLPLILPDSIFFFYYDYLL
uniref:RING-type domain-containing protein n=1 Tax=Leersia perrieri TaxID=77586 RepID=A0A0D9WXK6_9ORYZ